MRGGKEAINTNKVIVELFRNALRRHNLNPDIVQLITDQDRSLVDYMLSSMQEYIDLLIPRGGKTLVQKVMQNARIPILGHLEGICHLYIHSSANLAMATQLAINSKLRRPGICGAMETLLIDSKVLTSHTAPILTELKRQNCKIFVDSQIAKHFADYDRLATAADWSTEYLAPELSVKCVADVSAAIAHINTYGTQHTDAIVADDKTAAELFQKQVNSSIAMHNVSTQFADGGEFGFGAEVGISTNKLPPRGPVGVNQLVSYKYTVIGNGHLRD